MKTVTGLLVVVGIINVSLCQQIQQGNLGHQFGQGQQRQIGQWQSNGEPQIGNMKGQGPLQKGQGQGQFQKAQFGQGPFQKAQGQTRQAQGQFQKDKSGQGPFKNVQGQGQFRQGQFQKAKFGQGPFQKVQGQGQRKGQGQDQLQKVKFGQGQFQKVQGQGQHKGQGQLQKAKFGQGQFQNVQGQGKGQRKGQGQLKQGQGQFQKVQFGQGQFGAKPGKAVQQVQIKQGQLQKAQFVQGPFRQGQVQLQKPHFGQQQIGQGQFRQGQLGQGQFGQGQFGQGHIGLGEFQLQNDFELSDDFKSKRTKCKAGLVEPGAVREPPSFVYRADFREPTEVFKNGLKSLGSNDNLIQHTKGESTHYSDKHNTLFVSTSSSYEKALQWAKTIMTASRKAGSKATQYKAKTSIYVYKIRADENYFSMEDSLMAMFNKDSTKYAEYKVQANSVAKTYLEWEACGGVRPEEVKTATQLMYNALDSPKPEVENSRYSTQNTVGSSSVYIDEPALRKPKGK